ncbi:MAG: SulP family inorganic anion transporter [Bdellovibrionales bacterium]
MDRLFNLIPPFIKEIRLGWALREVWREGYNNRQLVKDLQAGVIVGIVALPLAMALAIASGVAPQHGLYTAVIAGVVIAALGGSRFQVAGPTAAFVVLLLPIVERFGLAGLLTAGFLAGLMCVGYGVLRLGDIIQYVPHPVTTGFTSGIALVIATLQFKDFLGLDIAQPSSDFVHRLWDVSTAFSTINFFELATGALTLTILLVANRRYKKVPSPILALGIVSVLVLLLESFVPGFEVATIAKRFTYLNGNEILPGVPRGLPTLGWPWRWLDTNSVGFDMSWIKIKELLPSAFAISLLGSIETLLSATVADGMTRRKHNPNSELIALGIGNILCPFFGGIPAAGAISRTTANIRFGAVSPISAIVHGLFLGLTLLILAGLISYIPMASLAALLLFIAWSMSERYHFTNILRIGSLDDRLVLLTCFTLTVLFDMTVGIGVGIILSSTLFIRRMALDTQSSIVKKQIQVDEKTALQVGSHVLYYEIRGTLFFGAAQRAMERLSNLSPDYTHAIIDLDDVSFIDITGKVALASAIQHLRSVNIRVALLAPDKHVQDELAELDVIKYGGADVKVIKSRSAAVYWAHPDPTQEPKTANT